MAKSGALSLATAGGGVQKVEGVISATGVFGSIDGFDDGAADSEASWLLFRTTLVKKRHVGTRDIPSRSMNSRSASCPSGGGAEEGGMPARMAGMGGGRAALVLSKCLFATLTLPARSVAMG